MTAPMQWFRLYNRMVDDEKLRLLAFEDRWHFVALCCLKSSGLLDEPDSDMRNRKIAVKLGIQVRELEEVSRRLREVELIDENLQPLAWNDLQYRSDNSTDRVKKYREKQGRNKVKRARNVSVTSQETEAETDTDTEEELETTVSCASGDAPALTPEHVVEKWNTKIVPLTGKPKVRDLTPERRVRLRARIAGYSLDDWREVLSNVERSPFLRGDTGWQGFSFDWMTKKTNFQKILEGNYNG